MKIYLAPMEGLTGNVYRSALLRHFGGVDKYFTPFITPSDKAVLGSRILRDVLPENNKGQVLVPQILTNNADGFLRMCDRLSQYGYTEFNLNLGCPSGTVVSKGRGAGFLAYPDELERFLDTVFNGRYKISVKTRVGMASGEEFYRLLEIYNKYDMTELIIHPRTRADMYNNHPDWELFKYAVENSKNTLCYNGDIFTVEDYKTFTAEFPQIGRVMLGRGVLINPALPLIIKGGEGVTAQQLKAFYFDVYNEYAEILSGSTPLMHKMKELLGYMSRLFADSEKTCKKIKKAKNIGDFNAAVYELFDGCELEI
jgi:tRNA-dihydrouridine synthase